MFIRRACLFLLVCCGFAVGCPTAADDDDDDDVTDDDDDVVTIDPATFCVDRGLPRVEFHPGPYGGLRHEIAGDFTIRTKRGPEWVFSEQFSGCESYVFLVDSRTVSANDSTLLIEKTEDIVEMLRKSPPNVHYFFISRADSGEAENAVTGPLRERLDAMLADWPADMPESAEHWDTRLHVGNDRVGRLDGWLDDALRYHGRLGLAVDRMQTVRGMGSFADVFRRDESLEWPWENNIAYAAHEVQYYNFEAERQARLDAETDVTIVTPWDGEILQEYADIEVEFPDAAALASFDTLEIDLVAHCPNEILLEQSNCGPWDYLAHIYIRDEADENWIEMARFITTYHRAGRYLVDATPALVHLGEGGLRTIRYSFAPAWNVQPTLTKLDFRFSNRGKGYRPTEATYLFSGGSFNGSYNEGREPVEVAVPAGATRVELVAIITGHGAADGNNCAEFCDHQHTFVVDGNEFLKTHPAIGNPEGCLETISTGTVPNQSGTWWTGRGGWCPGRQVDPYVVDVTDIVTPGAGAIIEYSALWDGRQPPPDGGNVLMNSWLVVYE